VVLGSIMGTCEGIGYVEITLSCL